VQLLFDNLLLENSSVN